MPMAPFIGPTYQHQSRPVSQQRTSNLYPEKVDVTDPKSNYILIGTPGSDLYLDLEDSVGETGQCRGVYAATNGQVYTVFGGNIYKIELSDPVSATLIGVIGSGGNTPVSLADNGYYLMVADGSNLYRYKFSTGVFAEEVLPFASIFRPRQVVYFEQRFVLLGTGIGTDASAESNKFYYSELGPEAAVSWDALNFYSGSGGYAPNPLQSMAVKQGELWVFTDLSYTVWTRSGLADNPLSKVGGSASQIGCSAPFSLTTIAENVFWYGSSEVGNNTIYMSSGYNAVRISNHAIEYQLSEKNKLTGVSTSDCFSWSYQENGHIFVIFNFISANLTYVYDVLTNQWHERTSRDPLRNIERRWSSVYGVRSGDSVITGNTEGAQLLTLSSDMFTEWNKAYNPDPTNQYRLPIIRERISPIYWDNMQTLFVDEMRIDMQVGVGNVVSGDRGYEPVALFRVDRGNGFGNERSVPIGGIGQYLQGVAIRTLGSGRSFVVSMKISDPVKVVLYGARITSRKANNR